MTLKNNLTRYLSQKKCIDAVFYPAVANIILQYIGDPRLRWKKNNKHIFRHKLFDFRLYATILNQIKNACLNCDVAGKPRYNDICYLCYIEGFKPIKHPYRITSEVSEYLVSAFDFCGKILIWDNMVGFYEGNGNLGKCYTL